MKNFSVVGGMKGRQKIFLVLVDVKIEFVIKTNSKGVGK
jgi:hypothetical protein